MAIFGPTTWVNPFGKMAIFSTFWTSCFYSLGRRFFLLEYDKRHFPGLYCLKRNFGKMVIFGLKPWVNNLFGKMPIFRLVQVLVYIALKGVFSFQNIVKDIFLDYITLKEILKKWLFLDQNHWLTRLKKWPFFDILNFFFLQPTKAFFPSTIS